MVVWGLASGQLQDCMSVMDGDGFIHRVSDRHCSGSSIHPSLIPSIRAHQQVQMHGA